MKNRIWLMISGVLLAAGIVLLCFSIFGDDTMIFGEWNLGAGMFCVTAANLLNALRLLKDRREKDDQPKEQ